MPDFSAWHKSGGGFAVSALGVRRPAPPARCHGKAGQGHRAVIFYLVQRTDANRMALAADSDAAYARAFEAAQAAGVEALAYGCQISPLGISLGAA
ncbi:MAG: DNA/RNA nuclease SfsA, partial [Rhodobacteraceae bacterium]|nr:DNA/RNA nuclease SfsA [Paracoccaceae bacterium]